MSERLSPAALRASLYALNELLLDLIIAAQAYLKLDLESCLIFMCVNEATMRPFMLANAEPIPDEWQPPTHRQGAISRRSIADRTGLPRETVRRKVKRLVEIGVLTMDAEGLVRASTRLDDVDAQRTLQALESAVRRYVAKRDAQKPHT